MSEQKSDGDDKNSERGQGTGPIVRCPERAPFVNAQLAADGRVGGGDPEDGKPRRRRHGRADGDDDQHRRAPALADLFTPEQPPDPSGHSCSESGKADRGMTVLPEDQQRDCNA